ncbi:MAG: hypothetical protein KY455_02080 [Euryarchaeota archaeon]|nr:hypothetical protein [Euryarchaeota archaeon]
MASVSPVVQAQDQIPEFQIDATLENTAFDLIPGHYHKVRVTVNVTCEAWSPTMELQPTHFRNEVTVEGIPPNDEVFTDVDDPSAALVFGPTDCVNERPHDYQLNITIRTGKGFDAFQDLTFTLSVKAETGTGEDVETWKMRTGFAGDIGAKAHSPQEIFQASDNRLHINIANWGNADVAGRVTLNASSTEHIHMEAQDFGPIAVGSAAERGLVLRISITLSDEALTARDQYLMRVDVSLYPVAEPEYHIPTQTVEIMIDTRPLGQDSENVYESPGAVGFLVLALAVLLLRRLPIERGGGQDH